MSFTLKISMTRLTVYCFVSLLLTAGNRIGLDQETVVRPVPSNRTFNNPLKGWSPYPNQIQSGMKSPESNFSCFQPAVIQKTVRLFGTVSLLRLR